MLKILESFRRKQHRFDPTIMDAVKAGMTRSRIAVEKSDEPTTDEIEVARTREAAGSLRTQMRPIIESWVQRHPDVLISKRETYEDIVLTRTGRLSSPAKRATISALFTGTQSPPLREREEPTLGPEKVVVPSIELRLLLDISTATIVDKTSLSGVITAIRSFLNQTEKSISSSLSTKDYSVEKVKKQIQFVIQGPTYSTTRMLEVPDEVSQYQEFYALCIQTIRDAMHAPDDKLLYTAAMHREILLQRAIEDQATMPVVIVAHDNFLSARYTSDAHRPAIQEALLRGDAETNQTHLNVVGFKFDRDTLTYSLCPVSKGAS